MPRPGFSLFVEQSLVLYDRLLREGDLRKVVRRCEAMLSQLRHFEPLDDDEQINLETAAELYEELLMRTRSQLMAGR